MPEMNAEPVQFARATLRDDAIPRISEARAQLEAVASDQTEIAWGIESGPTAFKDAFLGFLSESEQQLVLMETKLAEYEQSIGKTAQEFVDTDSNVAAQARAHEHQAQGAADVADRAW